MNIIEVDGLGKTFRQRVMLAPISFDVAQGSIFGVVGALSSGKTTLARILVTLLNSSEGDAYINGASVRMQKARARQLTGYVPTDFGAYNDLTLLEYLKFFAGCFNVPSADRSSTAEDLLQLVDLYHRKDDAIERLARSQLHRLALARAMVHDPPVLILDEPFLHLDPRGTVEMRELFRELQSLGKTIVLTSAVPTEVNLCDAHVVLPNDGTSSPASAGARLRSYHVIEIRYQGHTETALEIARACRGVLSAKSIDEGEHTMQDSTNPAASPQIMRVNFQGGFRDASALLHALVRGAVQVVTFRDMTEAPILELEIEPAESLSSPHKETAHDEPHHP